LPPLRERPGDILPLARQFLARYATRPGSCFDAAAEAALQRYSWRGNVRELENCVQRAAILARGNVLREEDLILTDSLQSARDTVPAHVEQRPALEGDLKNREQELILQALESSGGSRKATAERLGISPRTLRYKLARLREQGVALPASV
jgi:two-component system response regulator FlrC